MFKVMVGIHKNISLKKIEILLCTDDRCYCEDVLPKKKPEGKDKCHLGQKSLSFLAPLIYIC